MARGADSGELELLYRERFGDFLRIALAIVDDEALARDAVQESFARALRSRRSFRGEGTLDGWVWGILVNVARTIRASQLRGLDGDVAEIASAVSEDELEFRRWVAALPERQRLAVFLRYWADLDYRSIATALEVEVGTVSATLAAAHAALRRSLKEVAP